MLDISLLNPAQQSAVTAAEKALLVIAGAGSGKTRTLVYRLAWLIEQGISPHHILLLTFTRKAAAQMLDRASVLIQQSTHAIRSGTFHAFAFSVLRQHPKFCLRMSDSGKGQLTIMDSADQSACLAFCKDALKIGKGDRSFPKAQTVTSLISKARNKELSIEEVIRRESPHLLPHAEHIEALAHAATDYRRRHGLFDYDDLLFEFETLLRENEHVLALLREQFTHIMIDEYQDTNKVQARLIHLLAGGEQSSAHVMAVGDDAQSIYGFRGATVKNILDFPQLFPNTRVIYLEENYRSLQPILDVANAVLSSANEGYKKHLYSHREINPINSFAVRLYKPLSDLSQARIACQRIQDLLLQEKPSEIAVLFRSGYHSYQLELELNKRGIAFRKYGGIKYTEASHIKDLLAYARLIINPQDMPAFERIASFAKGIGVKTAQKLYNLSQSGNTEKFEKELLKFTDFTTDIQFINEIRINQFSDTIENAYSPDKVIEAILAQYSPKMEDLYPDDFPRRLQGLEELTRIASDYKALDLFIADLVLDISDEDDTNENITLSTVHSAKGLEWDNVLIMDLVEDRFPSRHAIVRPEDFEEERRLLYVACTRARNTLALFAPATLYQRNGTGYENAVISPFLRSLPYKSYVEYQEVLGGGLFQKNQTEASYENSNVNSKLLKNFPSNNNYLEETPAMFHGENKKNTQYGYCTHKVFGRGKIISEVDSDKYNINFGGGIGVKKIIKGYVTLEEDK